MSKEELMKQYTAEQLAEMVEKLQEQAELPQEILTEKERKMTNNIISIVVGGIAKEYQIEEIWDIVRAYEEIKLCKEMNKECKTILPSEYLKILSLNQTVSELQSEVDKYRKAFEEIKKERDYQISEYKKKINELEQHHKFSMMQIDDVLVGFLGVTHEIMDKPSDFEKVLQEVIDKNKTVSDFLPIEPIKVADILINASKKRTNCMTGKEYDKYIFEKWQLRQIAEHLLVYCNHNGEDN